jgi:heat-inducible transcriptional repressor
MLPPANDSLTQDLLALVSEVMEQADGEVAGKLYRDGLLNVLNEPEFSENETARRALRVLEERPLLEDLLSQTIKNSEVGGIQVIIGGDGGLEELSDCSIILSRYGVPDSATGMLGVLGPIRMRYGRSISTVRYISRLLSAHVQESQFE